MSTSTRKCSEVITTRETKCAARRPVWIEAETIAITLTSLHRGIDVLMLAVSNNEILLPGLRGNDKLEALGPT